MKDSVPAGAKKVLTLVYILRGEDPSGQEVLLGLKKRGFGCGKWNGFGGKVDADETVPEAAVREVQEECGLTVRQEDLVDVGTLDFEFVGDPVHLEVHVFETRQFSGEVTESEEMAPKWFALSGMPYNDMWLDDVHWHPVWLQGRPFDAYFLYEGYDKILEHKISERPRKTFTAKDDILASVD